MNPVKIVGLSASVLAGLCWTVTWFTVSGSPENVDPLELTEVSSTLEADVYWLDAYAKSDLFDIERRGLGEKAETDDIKSTVQQEQSNEDTAERTKQIGSSNWKLVAIIKDETSSALIELPDASFLTLAEGDEVPDGRVINKIGTRQIWLAEKSKTALTQIELFRFE